ncbi:MAG: hypothetical protein KJZ78_18415 [Bryobacteraceae bacterium]|nr:hypothetical protein [Bryobacteraceae bacterium]
MPDLRLLKEEYPLYSADGRCFGFRSRTAVQRLLSMHLVRPVYGRKGHLKAVYLPDADGSHPVTKSTRGTKYSYLERFEAGSVAWALKKLGKGDELRPLFQQVVADCLATEQDES